MNVILIDDEAVAVNALRRRVDWKKHGIDQVLVAYSMKEAQEVFLENPIDLMLSDIEMPQGNGLELFEWVKGYYPAVECIYVTCHAEYDYLRKAMQLGSADYVLKPIVYEDLEEILAAAVERIRRKRRAKAMPTQVLQAIEDGKSRKLHPKDDVVDTVRRYIREHIQEDIYISEIAKQVFLNEQYLMRLFKKATGISILEFITEERIWLAKELLRSTDYPVYTVADMAGYGNYSYFTRIFKRQTGMTPQKFRQDSQTHKTEE